jgi:hypothetical protein
MTEHTVGERWLDVPGYEGSYEVSDHGQVRSIDRVIYYIDGRSRWYPGLLLGQRVKKSTRSSYLVVAIGKQQRHCVHTLVLTAFVGPRPLGKEGCHYDGDHFNNRLTNLRWGTPTENAADLARYGIHYKRLLTHCPIEHLLQLPNLDRSRLAKGHRSCLACQRARGNEQVAKHRGKLFDFKLVADQHYARIMGL